jgi:lactam utilization protein B
MCFGKFYRFIHYIFITSVKTTSNIRTMNETVKLAKAHNVAVGAHPGLPDLKGFGRRNIDRENHKQHSH